MPNTPTLAQIQAARGRIAPHVHTTPTLTSATLAERSGAAACFLKCESLQKTGSFKVRGALNMISQLDAAALKRGVVTFSAGNHAQAVAWAARIVGTHATVVMPETASETKAAASAGYGADVVRYKTGADALNKARELEREHGYVFVHPFDDLNVITGAATAGVELLEQTRDADVVVVPIGGGGLISGIASAVKQMSPRTRVYGVEPTGAAAMRQSLDQGHAVHLSTPAVTIADGLAAPMAGDVCFPIVRDLVDDVVLVSEDDIAAAMSFLLGRAKLLAEGGGAAATAALLAGKIPDVRGKRVVAVVSGGNIDLDKLKSLV